MNLSKKAKCTTLLLFVLMGYQAASQPYYKFIENKGQWHSKVKFRTILPSGYLYMLKNSIKFMFYDGRLFRHQKTDFNGARRAPNKMQMHAYEVIFKNAKRSPKISPKARLQERRNYILGREASEWVTDVETFQGLVYENLYSGIDLEYLEHTGDLKYQFIVKSEGNPRQIAMLYEGQSAIKLENGQLEITTKLGKIIEQKPFAYQWKGKEKKKVRCEYILKNNEVGFVFPDGYDTSQELIIDPRIIFSTYSGSSEDNWGFTATYDELGNVYTGGIVRGNLPFPHSNNAFQTDYKGGDDIAILKFAPDGKTLIYATYLGGNDLDIPSSIIVNSRGELVILGSTGSTNFPITPFSLNNRFQGGSQVFPFSNSTTDLYFRNGSDIFLAILSADGSRLINSTYLGGAQNDGLNVSGALKVNYGDIFRSDVILDNNDQIYLVSSTSSFDFPTSVGTLQPRKAGAQDMVLAKFSRDLNRKIWSTYLGGNKDDSGYVIKMDKNNNLIIGGGTTSTDLPMTSGTLHSSYQGGSADGFITVVSNDGRRIVNSTYMGTSAYDQVFLLDLNTDGSIVAFGQTQGGYPVINARYSNSNSTQFIHELTADLRTTNYSTVIGSRQRNVLNIVPTAFLVDNCSKIYVSGWGNTQGLPITTDAFQATTDGQDFYLMILEKNASQLLYATYMGANERSLPHGDHVDGGTSRFDKAGIVYQAVCSCSSNAFPTTAGVYSRKNKSTNCNNVAFKFDLSVLKADFTISQNSTCAPSNVTFVNKSIGGVQYIWNFGDGSPSQTSARVSHLFQNPGQYSVSLTVLDPSSCKKQDVITKKITVRKPNIQTNFPTEYTVCKNDPFTLDLTNTGAVHFEWTNLQGQVISTEATLRVTPDQKTTYNIRLSEQDRACRLESPIEVNVLDELNLDYKTVVQDKCHDKSATVRVQNNSEADSFIWRINRGQNRNSGDTEEFSSSGAYLLNIEARKGSCVKRESKQLNISLVDPPNVFTPNKDGFNDSFAINKGTAGTWEIEVFNRWGHRVFYDENYNDTWTGQDLKKGTYYYSLTFKDTNKNCKGWLQILDKN